MRNEVKLFLAGIKPALALSLKQSEDLESELSRFPKLELNSYNLYFRSETEKEFLLSEDGVYSREDGSVRRIRSEVLGLALGYPYKAVEYFCSDRYKERVQVNWHGINFICHPSDVHECAGVMEWTYDDIPDELKTGITFRRIKDAEPRPVLDKPLADVLKSELAKINSFGRS